MDTTAIVIAVISSGAFTAIITGIVNYFVSKKSYKQTREQGIADGVMILLEERINRICRRHLDEGYIYTDDKDRLERMWAIYHHNLGGNGYLDEVMKLMEKLPTKVR